MTIALCILSAVAGAALGVFARRLRIVRETDAIAVVIAARDARVWFGAGPEQKMRLSHALEPGLYLITHRWHRPVPGSDDDAAIRAELFRRIRQART